MISPTSKVIDEFTVSGTQRFDGGVDVFWDKMKGDYKFILEKKQDYLNWRISDPQWGTYRVAQATRGGDVLGFVVTRISEEDGYKEGYVMDLLALRDRMDVVDTLLSYAVRLFDNEGVNVVYYQITKGHPYQRRSEKHGFIESNSRPNIEFNYSHESGLSGDIPFLVDVKTDQVYFSYGDTV